MAANPIENVGKAISPSGIGPSSSSQMTAEQPKKVRYISSYSYLMDGERVPVPAPKKFVPVRDILTEEERAVVESVFPTKWFTDFYAANGMKVEGPCEKCHDVHNIIVPGSTCEIYTPPRKIKENAIKIKKLGEETEAAHVRKLCEVYGPLRSVDLCESYAIVTFVHVHDADRALEMLEGDDGYEIEWAAAD